MDTEPTKESTVNTETPRITVVGSYNHGLTVSSPTIPVPGETVLGSDFEEGVGGKGSNQAVAAARLGAEATFVGRIGDDRFGEEAIALWEREGVDHTYVDRVPDVHTGVGFVIVDDDGENAIVVAPGANSRLDASAVETAVEAIRNADVVLCQLETEPEPVRVTMELAEANGIASVLNPAPARELPAELLGSVSYLTPNRTEARILAGYPPDADVDDHSIAAELLDRGVSTVVLTQGADGALVVTPDESVSISAPDVDVVDTTGAGDAFNAGFAVALAEGHGPVKATRFGCRTGSLACTGYEVVPALPEREAVDALES